ncbi:hypothetical protein AB1K56_07080 [Microbacterium sp. BWR-S6Y]
MVDLAREYIAGEGLPVTSYPRPTRLMDISDEIHPDLDVAGVAVSVTSRRTLRLSDDLDSAVGIANLSGSPVGAVLQWRGDKPISDAYLITRLSDFLTLVHTARANIDAAP